MTEEQWLTCTNSGVMLDFLQRKSRRGKFKVSDRKYRLYFCARCRCDWKRLKDSRSRQAVRVAERFADGLVGPEKLRQAETRARQASDDAFETDDTDAQRIATVAYWATFEDPGTRARGEVGCAEIYDDWCRDEAADFPDQNAANRQIIALTIARRLEQADHAEVLHDLLGNVIRPLKVKQSWRSPKVVRLAKAIYNKRIFERMPELADALEQAGCDAVEVLAHCRQPLQHSRGCWVVDLLLGKE